MKSTEKIIYEAIGIKEGADKFTPLDYFECKLVARKFAVQAIEEQISRIAMEVSDLCDDLDTAQKIKMLILNCTRINLDNS